MISYDKDTFFVDFRNFGCLFILVSPHLGVDNLFKLHQIDLLQLINAQMYFVTIAVEKIIERKKVQYFSTICSQVEVFSDLSPSCFFLNQT